MQLQAISPMINGIPIKNLALLLTYKTGAKHIAIKDLFSDQKDQFSGIDSMKKNL
jgi:hypothetical protein